MPFTHESDGIGLFCVLILEVLLGCRNTDLKKEEKSAKNTQFQCNIMHVFDAF